MGLSTRLVNPISSHADRDVSKKASWEGGAAGAGKRWHCITWEVWLTHGTGFSGVVFLVFQKGGCPRAPSLLRVTRLMEPASQPARRWRWCLVRRPLAGLCLCLLFWAQPRVLSHGVDLVHHKQRDKQAPLRPRCSPHVRPRHLFSPVGIWTDLSSLLLRGGGQLWCVVLRMCARGRGRADLSCYAIWAVVSCFHARRAWESGDAVCSDVLCGRGERQRRKQVPGSGAQVPHPACAWRICLMFSAEESRFLPRKHGEA
ncbi:hypothetical protein QBC39DRAFT_336957 [Podospora conica]|nr:hypothetical protein QBC39DRAFT_336957 [Schizothecium conicum]